MFDRKHVQAGIRSVPGGLLQRRAVTFLQPVHQQTGLPGDFAMLA